LRGSGVDRLVGAAGLAAGAQAAFAALAGWRLATMKA
jgi:hypothetical protein